MKNLSKIEFICSKHTTHSNNTKSRKSCGLPKSEGDKKMVLVSHDKKIPYTVLVEGNVGAGKSTLVEILSREDPRSVRVYP